ncbi:hypothetical protein FTV88_2724 [Heliorestis convoluta]|uniref:Uncharacterized protein n=1 Tax=Heliorestis convoluta TaxID=356322 RepID=A0A5Q2N4G4_9FIRM|nr:hypothetical protein FTV88_2724 [Heliorestis convoluta]
MIHYDHGLFLFLQKFFKKDIEKKKFPEKRMLYKASCFFF